MAYQNIKLLLGAIMEDIAQYRKAEGLDLEAYKNGFNLESEEYRAHLDEYVFPQICKIYETINNKIDDKVRYNRVLDSDVILVYCLSCFVFNKKMGVRITCKNAVFNDLDKWISCFNEYVL